MSRKDENILCNLDMLKHLINEVLKKEQFTIAQSYINYYNEIVQRPRIVEILQENNRTDHHTIQNVI